MRLRAAGGGSFRGRDSQRRWWPHLTSASVGRGQGTERKLGIGSGEMGLGAEEN